MNFGGSRINTTDILQIQQKSINLRIVDDNSSVNNMDNIKQSSMQSNKIGIGQLNIANTSGRNGVIYKIRGNRPKNYRLANPCNIVDVGQSAKIEIRLGNAFLYTPKDLFEIRYLEFTPELQSIYKQKQCQSIYQFWQIVDQDVSSYKIKQVQLSVEMQDAQFFQQIQRSRQQANLLIGSSINNSQQKQFQSPINMRSTSPTMSSGHSPFSQKQASQSLFNNTSRSVANGTGLKSNLDQNMFYSQNRKISSNFNGIQLESNISQNYHSPFPMLSSNQFSQQQDDYKQLYEKLVIKVDEQDKQLFVLNQERKKLEQDWKLLSKKQEQLKNNEFQEQKLKNINGIQPTSALIIGLISLLIGIYLGN